MIWSISRNGKTKSQQLNISHNSKPQQGSTKNMPTLSIASQQEKSKSSRKKTCSDSFHFCWFHWFLPSCFLFSPLPTLLCSSSDQSALTNLLDLCKSEIDQCLKLWFHILHEHATEMIKPNMSFPFFTEGRQLEEPSPNSILSCNREHRHTLLPQADS